VKIDKQVRLRASHIWARESTDWYVEPQWISSRLFDVELFTGTVHDPAVGLGHIVAAAWAHGYPATGADIINRNGGFPAVDFLTTTSPLDNVVCNPPFALAHQFAAHALARVQYKVALLFPTARLNAAGKWLTYMPLFRVWLITPRPSMPPGEAILRSEKAKGGRTDFVWIVLDKAFTGAPTVGWLTRSNGGWGDFGGQFQLYPYNSHLSDSFFASVETTPPNPLNPPSWRPPCAPPSRRGCARKPPRATGREPR
jgi:hypothetical protein